MASTWVGAPAQVASTWKVAVPVPGGVHDQQPRPPSAAQAGEVPDQQACLRSLGQVLKPGGRLVFVEMFPDPDRLSVRELRDLVEPENFEFVEATGNRWEDVVRFRRVGA